MLLLAIKTWLYSTKLHFKHGGGITAAGEAVKVIKVKMFTFYQLLSSGQPSRYKTVKGNDCCLIVMMCHSIKATLHNTAEETFHTSLKQHDVTL